MKNTLTIYACGGTGANIAQRYVDLPQDKEKPLYPRVNTYIVDTSDSNIDPFFSGAKHFIIPGMSGTGKHRKASYEAVEPHITPILNELKPGIFNLVIFSAAGGSGSVIGPLIAAELLRRNLPTVCVVVGSAEDLTDATNTNETLRSLQGMAKNGQCGGRPIAMCYFENKNKDRDGSNDRSSVDKRISYTIRQLSLLFNGLHRELDRTDLINWLNWRNKYPDIAPKLIEIIPFTEEQFGELEAYTEGNITLAMLKNNETDVTPDVNQIYTAEGFIDDRIKEYATIPNHAYLLTTARLSKIMSNIISVVERGQKLKEELRNAEGVDDGWGDANEAGMFLS